MSDVNWEAVSAIATVLATIAILVGVPVALMQLRRSARAAESQHVMDVLKRWDEDPLEKARHELNKSDNPTELLETLKNYDKAGDKKLFVLLRVPGFFEDLGWLVFGVGVVKVESVRSALGSSVTYYWERFELCAKHMRETHNDPSNYEWFEKLHEHMKEEADGC